MPIKYFPYVLGFLVSLLLIQSGLYYWRGLQLDNANLTIEVSKQHAKLVNEKALRYAENAAKVTKDIKKQVKSNKAENAKADTANLPIPPDYVRVFERLLIRD